MPQKIYVSFLFLLLLAACSSREEKVNIRLTMAERGDLDARVIAHMDTIRPAMEAFCDSTREEMIALATDSIVQRRLEEEARMRARIPESLRQ